jgi:hypothetical protein
MVKILHNVMKSFKDYIELKSLLEAESPSPAPTSPNSTGTSGSPPLGGPVGGPGGIAGGPMGGLPPMPPSGGSGMPLGGPPMGDTSSLGAGGSGGQNTPSNKLKAYNVWDVLEKILGAS